MNFCLIVFPILLKLLIEKYNNMVNLKYSNILSGKEKSKRIQLK